VSFLLSSGPGILLLTILACSFVVALTMLAATIALALVLAVVRLLGRLSAP
jgi:hypothetical protein